MASRKKQTRAKSHASGAAAAFCENGEALPELLTPPPMGLMSFIHEVYQLIPRGAPQTYGIPPTWHTEAAIKWGVPLERRSDKFRCGAKS